MWPKGLQRSLGDPKDDARSPRGFPSTKEIQPTSGLVNTIVLVMRSSEAEGYYSSCVYGIWDTVPLQYPAATASFRNRYRRFTSASSNCEIYLRLYTVLQKLLISWVDEKADQIGEARTFINTVSRILSTTNFLYLIPNSSSLIALSPPCV